MDTNRPIDVPGINNAALVASGGDPVNDNHTCMLTTAKGVQCWGINTEGQLGRNMTGVGGPVPGAVIGVSDVTALSSSGGFSCALTSTGVVLCWGNNAHHQLGPRATGSISATALPITGL
jgi:alpha-tubulin suppressor-like RCC1 family protein